MSNGQEDASSPLPPDALAANSWFMNALRTTVYWGITRWLTWHFHLHVEGAEVFRHTPQFILISNHSSHIDAVCLLAALPARLRNRCFSAAASDYFYTNPVRKWAARLFANTFPFTRHTNPQGGLDACARILARGDSLIFFPEGTRSVTGELQPFKKGIGTLAQGSPYPVIPAYLHGAHQVLGKGRFALRTAHLRLTFGHPQVFSAVPTSDESAEMIANGLHDVVQALGQDGA